MTNEPKLLERISKPLAHHWLRGVFLLFSVFSLFSLLRHEFSGHFRTFEEAARRIHQGITPYGSDFGLGVGKFFYSPTAALYFFRAFLPFPEKLGLFLYMSISILVFFAGARLYLRTQKNGSSWILLLALPQVYAAVIAAKLELIMMGLLFASIAWIQKNPKNKWAPVLFALPIAWKYQPIPIFGLIAIASILFGNLNPALYTFAGLAFWLIAPALEIGFSFYFQILAQMQSSLGEFTAQAYASFDNLFAAFHMPLNAFIYLVIFGAFSSMGALVYTIEKYKISWSEAVELSFVLGSAYIVLLSPLQQNNAYILWLPILFAAATRINFNSRVEKYLFFTLWIWVALGYSDLMPPFIRVPFREHALKPVFTLAFTLFTLLGVMPNARHRLKSQSSH